MSGGSVVLDTNVAIHYLAGRPEIRDRIEGSPDRFVLAFASVGELYYGAHKSTRVAENRERVERFIAGCDVLHTTGRTVEIFGELKGELKRAGTPIPENDIWIAALCVEHGMGVVTRDKHFERLRQRVRVVRW